MDPAAVDEARELFLLVAQPNGKANPSDLSTVATAIGLSLTPREFEGLSSEGTEGASWPEFLALITQKVECAPSHEEYLSTIGVLSENVTDRAAGEPDVVNVAKFVDVMTKIGEGLSEHEVVEVLRDAGAADAESVPVELLAQFLLAGCLTASDRQVSISSSGSGGARSAGGGGGGGGGST